MQLPVPLHRGRLSRRYKRFLADATLADGTEVTAHIADPGRLPGLADPGAGLWLSHRPDPRRKLAWRVELIEAGNSLVGANTGNANHLAAEAIAAGALPSLAGWRITAREPRLDPGTRLDFRLEGAAGRPALLEVKNITWRRDGVATFPDAVTTRGTRHLEALAGLAAAGTPAYLLFVCQRADVASFAVADDVDPAYARAFAAARAAGVRVVVCRCEINHYEINIIAEIVMG